MSSKTLSLCVALIFTLVAFAPLASACDTWIAMGDSTYNGRILFGKNSDRPPFDCQPLIYNPQQFWGANATLKLEYIEIPQVGYTYATIGASPYWCYGYEMGMNEFGVVVGNEAVHTYALEQNKLTPPERGLLGMDMLRIGLERGQTAREVMDTITLLLETYGQWGSGAPGQDDNTGSYDNSFIIADSTEAWILESAGRDWVAKRIAEGTDSISNVISLQSDWDEGSIAEGTNFKLLYSNEADPVSLSGESRELRSQRLLDQYSADGDKVTLQEMMAIARDHEVSVPGICMHPIPMLSDSVSAGSWVVSLPSKQGEFIELWWCAYFPCQGIYVPAFFTPYGFPDIASNAGTLGKSVSAPNDVAPDEFKIDSYWWLFKKAADDQMDDERRTSFNSLEQGFIDKLDTMRPETEHLFSSGGWSLAYANLTLFTEESMDSTLSLLISEKLSGIDTESPTITDLKPETGISLSDNNLRASSLFNDNVKVDRSRVRIMLDGTDVTDDSSISSDGFSLNTILNGAKGDAHDLSIEIFDVAGNKASMNSVFSAGGPSGDEGETPGFGAIALLSIVLLAFVVRNIKRKK
ncbi:MAG: hypothetical protein CVV03_12735 [Firmicutes bacterium HGW-Firmicutes-8]|nr:MAG: hypothetical protein CVV03_12735 [Firmicutes bacterium HGW-Firmicutes-8]